MAYKTVRDMVQNVGQKVIRDATGKSDRTIRLWKLRNEIPAKHYAKLKEATNGEAQTNLFNFDKS